MKDLPNRYFHTFFIRGLQKIQKAAEDKNSPAAKELEGKAMADALEDATGESLSLIHI